jgi:hypothetical protein
MSISSEQNFGLFFKSLYEKHSRCFKTDYNVWTEKYHDEDWFLAVFLRTIICNDNESEKLFLKLGKHEGVMKKFELSEDEFKKWFDDKANGIVVGGGVPGAHRPAHFKPHNSRALFEYIEMTNPSQKAFFMNKSSYDQIRDSLFSIHSVKKLTSFDIQNRLFITKHKHIEVFPEKAYDTGRGPRRGLELIYSDLDDNNYMEKYNQLGRKIQNRISIKPEIFWSELEDIICIYQKPKTRKDAIKMLAGSLSPEAFADIYARINCNKIKTC